MATASPARISRVPPDRWIPRPRTGGPGNVTFIGKRGRVAVAVQSLLLTAPPYRLE